MNTAATVAMQTNPFPGLRPFREDEEYLFFGRESQVDAMVNTLAATRFLAVVGTSGSGKSSLVNCGLRPALHRGLMTRAGTAWRMAQFRPGSAPLGALARTLAGDGVLFRGYEAGGLTLAEIIDTTLRMSKLGLIDIYEQARLSERVNLLVVVDQFEELFRYRQLGAAQQEHAYGVSAEAAAFVNLLLEVREQTSCSIYVVLTMRSDFLGDCAQFSGLPEAINAGQYLVPRLTRDERRAAISGPVVVGGAEIAPVLLTRLVNDVGDNPDQLSILQHALNRTWARWQQEGDAKRVLDLTHYDAIGTMAHALDQHAENAYAKLGGERQQHICAKLLKALTDTATDPRGVRRPTTLGALCALTAATVAEVTEVIDVFREPSRSFLMPPAGEALTPDTVIDISHESLMRVWERLKAWADEEAQSARLYRRLAETAVLHAAGKASLWSDPDLQLALDWQEKEQPTAVWAARYHEGFEPAMSFLQASVARRDEEAREQEARRQEQETQRQRALEQAQALAEEQQRRAEEQTQAAKRLRRLLWIVVASAMIAGGAAIVAVSMFMTAQQQARLATEGRQRAREGLTRAAAFRLIMVSQTRLANGRDRGDDERALLEAVAAQRVGGDGLLIPEVVNGLWRMLEAKKELLTIVRAETLPAGTLQTDEGPAIGVAWSPDGRRWLSAEDAALRVRDAATGQPIEPPLHAGPGRSLWRWVAYSPDGSRLAALTGGGELRLWDATTLRPLGDAQLVGLKPYVSAYGMAFSPDGSAIAVAGGDPRLALFDGRNATPRGPVFTVGSLFGFDAVAWSPDGKTLATTGEGSVRRWDAISGRAVGKPIKALDGENAGTLVYSADNRILVSGGTGFWREGVHEAGKSAIAIWDASSGRPIGDPLLGHTDSLTAVRVSPDGSYIASSSRDGTLRLWSTKDGSPIGAPLRGHGGSVGDLAISPDSSHIVSSGTDDMLRLWQVRGANALRGMPDKDQEAGLPGPTGVTFSAGATFAARLSPDGGLRWWDLRDGRTGESSLEGLGNLARPSLHISDDGRVAAIMHPSGSVELRDPTSGRLVVTIAPGLPLRNIAFSEDGERLATADSDGRVALWSARTGELRWTAADANAKGVRALAFDGAGEWLISVSADGSLERRRVSNGQRMEAPVKLERSNLCNNAGLWISRDGRRILALERPGIIIRHDVPICWWDANSGKLLHKPIPSIMYGANVSFSRDGRLAVLASLSGVCFWAADTGSPVGSAIEVRHGGSVVFDSTGRRIVWIDDGGALRSLPAPDDWADEACAKVSRNMSRAEWREWVSSEVDYVIQCPGKPIPPDAITQQSVELNKGT